MKRSEVLNIIDNQIELLLIEIANGLDLHKLDTKDYSLNLLTKLESIGMLPPEAYFKRTSTGCLCTMRESCISCTSGYYNNWEPEDE